MALDSLWKTEGAPSPVAGTRATWDLMDWLGAELKERAPGSAHRRLAENFLGALFNEPDSDWDQVRRVILKQEVWRLLVTLRAAGMDDSKVIAEVEGIVPGLAQQMEMNGAGHETVRQVHERLLEALRDVRDWPLV